MAERWAPRPRFANRPRGQRGASLALVLFLVAFLSLIVPSMLGLSQSGAITTSVVTRERRISYAANSALDAAIQQGRTARWVGRYGLACPSLSLWVASAAATVTCSSTTGPFDLDRTLAYTATVDGVVRARAGVVFRDATAGTGEPSVDVTYWTSRAT